MGRVDNLFGLKENIIMGHLIPAGTGIDFHRDIDLDREILKAVSMEETTEEPAEKAEEEIEEAEEKAEEKPKKEKGKGKKKK
jgi:DNA-directed RNA polymerase subunit beta'